MCYEFLIGNLDSLYNKLKPLNYYEDKIKTLSEKLFSESASLDENLVQSFNLMNAYRIQADESKIIKSNLEHLAKNKLPSIHRLM